MQDPLKTSAVSITDFYHIQNSHREEGVAATISAAVSFCVVEEKLDEINIGEAAGRVLKQVAASSSIPKPYEGRSEGVLPPAKKSKTTTSSKMRSRQLWPKTLAKSVETLVPSPALQATSP